MVGRPVPTTTTPISPGGATPATRNSLAKLRSWIIGSVAMASSMTAAIGPSPRSPALGALRDG